MAVRYSEKSLGGGENYRVLKRCTVSLLSRHLGLEESKITGHSNKRKNCKALKKGIQRVQIENSNHKRLVARGDRLVLTMSRSKYFNRNILRL